MVSRLNLLLIEDSAADALLIDRHLQQHGVAAQCTRVADTLHLARALDGTLWDVVLVDFNLPGVDFLGMLEQLKSSLPDVPIILVSATVGEEQAVDLLKAGVWDFVLKDRLARLVPAINRGLAEAAERRARRAAELALRESESRLMAFLEGTRCVAWIKDLEGRFVVVNGATEQALGLSREELIGHTVFDLFPHDLAEAYSRNDRVVIESGQATTVEERSRLADGEHTYSSIKFPIRDHSGRVYAVGALCSDITERKREHDARADAETRWQFALEGSDLGVWDWDARTNAVFYSPRWKAMLGYGATEISGSLDEWTSRVHPDDLSLALNALQRHMRSECEFYESEHRLRCKDGSYKWILDRGKVIERAADGSPLRIIGTHNDITDRRVLEDAIRDSEARANLILDTAPEAMLLIDARGIIIRSNDSAERVFGYSPGELVGLEYHALVPEELRVGHHAHHAGFMAAPRKRAMAEGRNLHALRRDGSRFPAEIGLSPIELGGEQQIIVTVLDVTVRKQAELELQRFASIVEVSGDMLSLVDRDLKYVVSNPAYAAHVGHTPASLRGRCLREVLGERMFGDVEARLVAALAGAPQHFTVERRFADGLRHVLDGEYRPFRVDGVVVGLVASLRDVTARVQAEEQFERAQAMASFGNWIYDVASDSFELSQQSQRMLARPHNHLSGAEMISMVHPDDAATVRTRGMATVKGGLPFDIEYRYIVNGKVLYVHAVADIARDAGGKVVRVIGVMQDITEAREAQFALQAEREQLERLVAARTAELRQQTTYLHALIDNFPFRVWLKDVDGRYLAANRANLGGLASDIHDLLGKTDHDLRPRHVADRYRAEDEEVMREQRPKSVEVEQADESGPTWSETYKAPVVGADGTVLGIVGYARDITGRKTLEAAREAALREAERLARVRSEFLANMSHEIRTPLSAMLGLAQVGLRDDAGRRSSETFSRILESGQLLLGVINDILDFSKIEAGKLSVERVLFDPCAAIDRAVDFAAAQADAKGLAFEVDESIDLPASCLGDALRLSQVLVNLLSNAVKFTETGAVSLSASCEGEWLRFDIVDTGIGMPPDQIERLFRPFEQADSSTTRRFGGTGLGLAISSRLVELMGGQLDVTSRLGEGSRFTLRLPLVGAEPPRPREQLSMALLGLGTEGSVRLSAALGQRGVTARIETSAAGAFNQEADLIVLGCGTSDDAVITAAEQALDRGWRVAVACHHDEPCTLKESLRERAAPIDFPLRARHLIAAAHGSPQIGRLAASAPDRPRLQGVRVLAAEDNALNRVVLDEIMRLEGAQLTLAEDGERALSLLHAAGVQAFDVVLTDIQMPGIDGYETARCVLAFAPSLPVIGLTAHAMREERERCLAAGMVEHVAKPIEIEVLVSAILRHVPPRAGVPPPVAHAAVSVAADAVPAIDWRALDARFPGRVAFIDRLGETLLQTQSETPARLRDAAAKGDLATIIFIGHTLKGMAGNLAAPRLFELARDTEAAGRAESPETGRLALRLADAMAEVIDSVKTRLAQRRPP